MPCVGLGLQIRHTMQHLADSRFVFLMAFGFEAFKARVGENV